ncbi:MAG: histidine kinase [Actinomycetota bacterium]|nr:histidine kinase [Actinomycetota bacterium]MDQ2956042.1 histidine kinase [Actinomycetota bacterium]
MAFGASATVDPPVRMRRVVVLIAAAAVVVAVVVGVAGTLVSRRIAEQQAVHDVAQLTDVLAESVVQPALTDAMPGDPTATRTVLDPLVRSRVLNPTLIRVKVWTPAGTVLYSDEPRLIGMTFPIEDEARAAFSQPRLEADVSDLRRPENQFERNRGKLLEVYRPVWTPDGRPLLFETYFRYDSVTARSHELWRGFAGVMLSSLAALLLLLLPLVWVLLARARRARQQRELLMRHALDASGDERRRIAASLHDGVVQQLAAASFTAAGQADQAARAGQPQLAAGLQTVAGTVRDSIAGLRSLLVDIYPPSLQTSGLAVALRDLARATTATEMELSTDLDEDVAEALPEPVQEAIFRVTQEALRNAVQHSGAARVAIRLSAVDADQALLEVIDNGGGLDAPTAFARGDDHFGLQLMADAARRAGAGLAFATPAGGGTALELAVPRR